MKTITMVLVHFIIFLSAVYGQSQSEVVHINNRENFEESIFAELPFEKRQSITTVVMDVIFKGYGKYSFISENEKLLGNYNTTENVTTAIAFSAYTKDEIYYYPINNNFESELPSLTKGDDIIVKLIIHSSSRSPILVIEEIKAACN